MGNSDTSTELRAIRSELAAGLTAINKRIERIERTTKRTQQTVGNVEDAVSWQALINDAILCALCLAGSFGATSIDYVKTDVCPELPGYIRNAVPFNFCGSAATTDGNTAYAAVNGDAIAVYALGWVGKEFKPGVQAQCAYFVREVLKQAGITMTPDVTSQPIDGDTPSLGTANSWGPDQGEVIKDKGQLKPGDIVMWANTYGDWSAGTITHVGIYVGNGMIVDRPTAAKPVQHRSIDTFPHFVAAVRLKGAEQPAVTGSTASVEKSLPFVLKWEGGDSNHPNDIGGATRKGITASSLAAYGPKAGVNASSPMQLSDEQVKAIYKAIWDDSKCGQYADPFATACFDTAVNFGVGGLGEFMQELSADPKADPKGAALELADDRIAYRHQRVAEMSSQRDFLEGWLNRDNDLKRLIESATVQTGGQGDRSSGGGWINPAPGAKFTSGFGFRVHDKPNFNGCHRGIDLAGPIGMPILAARGGTVVEAGWDNLGLGNMVLIDHGNGQKSRYGHMDRVTVSPGQKVEQGDIIGEMGTTGNSSGPHLHFEVDLGNGMIDPMPLLPERPENHPNGFGQIDSSRQCEAIPL